VPELFLIPNKRSENGLNPNKRSIAPAMTTLTSMSKIDVRGIHFDRRGRPAEPCNPPCPSGAAASLTTPCTPPHGSGMDADRNWKGSSRRAGIGRNTAKIPLPGGRRKVAGVVSVVDVNASHCHFGIVPIMVTKNASRILAFLKVIEIYVIVPFYVIGQNPRLRSVHIACRD